MNVVKVFLWYLRNFTIVLLCCIYERAESQEVALSKNIKFKDGLYFSFRDFASNSPSLSLTEINYSKSAGPNPTQKYLYNFRPAVNIAINFDTINIWGICIEGIPYINQTNIFKADKGVELSNFESKEEDKSLTFSSFIMIGHLCYFNAEGIWDGGTPVDNNNPLLLYDNTKRFDKYDFLPGTNSQISQQYLLKASTRQIAPFKSSKLLIMIQDDTDLYSKFNSYSTHKKNKEIFNIFREYNLRNPIIIEPQSKKENCKTLDYLEF